jgi:hypothetical protein
MEGCIAASLLIPTPYGGRCNKHSKNERNGATKLARNVNESLACLASSPLPTPSHCGQKQDGALLGWTRSRYLVIPRETRKWCEWGGTARSHKPFPREPGRLHLISIAPHPNPHSAHRPECGPRAAAAPPCTAGQVNQLLPETRKHTKPQRPPPPVGFHSSLVCLSALCTLCTLTPSAHLRLSPFERVLHRTRTRVRPKPLNTALEPGNRQ